MFVYNITIKVDNAILEEWIKWQKDEHIPDIMSTNLFDPDSYRDKFFRLLDQDDTEGQTFVFQYYTQVRRNYDQYIKKYASKFREKAVVKWGDAFFAFRSLMQSVQ